METSSHEVHETSSRRDDRHHFAEFQQVAAACDDEVALEVNRPQDIGQVSALVWLDGPGACHLENLCIGTMGGAIVSLQQTRYGVSCSYLHRPAHPDAFPLRSSSLNAKSIRPHISK